MWGIGFFKLCVCDFCIDVMIEFVDILLGDVWLFEYKKDGMGNSVVVMCSWLVDDIICEGIEIGELCFDFVLFDIVVWI